MTTRQENTHPLAEGYRRELETVWRKRDGSVDQHMVDWSLRDAEELIRLSDGRYYAISKPDIKKDFCFGYNTDFSGHEQSDAIRNECNFRKNGSRFKAENLRGCDDVLRALRDREGTRCFLYTRFHGGGAIAGISFVTSFIQLQQMDGSYTEMSETDRTAVTRAWEKVRDNFERRLDAYLRKYGTDKLHTWTYCRDD